PAASPPTSISPSVGPRRRPAGACALPPFSKRRRQRPDPRSLLRILRQQSPRRCPSLLFRTSCGSRASTSIGCPFAGRPAVSRTGTALALLVRSGNLLTLGFIGQGPARARSDCHEGGASAAR